MRARILDKSHVMMYDKTNNFIVLQSYDTIVAVLNQETGILHVTKQTHSRTTSRHIKAFRSKISFKSEQLECQQYMDALARNI
jgi:hypothetical protein